MGEISFKGYSLENSLDKYISEYCLNDSDIIFVESFYSNEWVFAFDINDHKYFEQARKTKQLYFVDDPSYIKYWENVYHTQYSSIDSDVYINPIYEAINKNLQKEKLKQQKEIYLFEDQQVYNYIIINIEIIRM